MDQEDLLLLTTVDSLNTSWLKRVVDRRGRPKWSEVGKAAAHNAWLLVQHADGDPVFQQEILRRLEVAVAAGEASGAELAYLADRVRTGRGELQLYGTQLRMGAGGDPEPLPIEAPERVDERRSAVGLPPLQEYLRQFKEFHEGD